MSGINKYYYLEKKRRGKSCASESPIGDIMEKILKNWHIDYNPYEQKVKELFYQYTGKVIEKFVTKLWIDKRILYVSISSPTVKSELNMFRDLLCRRINDDIGKEVIKSIIIR